MVNDRVHLPEEVDAEAASWLARLNSPYRTNETDGAFKAWLSADAAHRAAFERATDIWELLPGIPSASVRASKAIDAGRDDPRRSRRFAMAAGIIAMISIAGGYGWSSRAPAYETAIGGQQVVALADGTRLSLNTDTKVTVSFSEDGRIVQLDRGEAMFEVAKDPRRPFIVRAGKEEVRALGTSFVVRRDGEKLSVTLLEGRVEVRGVVRNAPPLKAVLEPGQRLMVTQAAGAALDRPSIEEVTAWRRGEIVLDDATLIEAAEELNRYGADHLVVADPSLASLRVSGVFATNDVAEAANAIAALHGLRVERAGRDVRLTRGNS